VIHGDIKPVSIFAVLEDSYNDVSCQDNILVEFSGNRLRAILCDFGLSLVGDVSELRLKTHQYARGTKGWYDTVVEDRAEDGKWLRWRPSRDIYAFGLVCLWVRSVIWTIAVTYDHTSSARVRL
jgi:serine/threonine protein kinase